MKIRNRKQSFAFSQFPSQIEFWERYLFFLHFGLSKKIFSLKNNIYFFWKQKIREKNSYQTYPKNQFSKKIKKNVFKIKNLFPKNCFHFLKKICFLKLFSKKKKSVFKKCLQNFYKKKNVCFFKKGKSETKKKKYIYINVFQSFSKEIFFKNVFLHTKVCFQKCFLKKIHAFQKKKKVFKNTFTALILSKKMFSSFH